jgi:hypothetical protein
MFSLIVPVYLNEAFVSALLARLERLHNRLPGGLEAVIVVDGSSDRSLERLAEALPRMPFPSQLLLLSGNFPFSHPHSSTPEASTPDVADPCRSRGLLSFQVNLCLAATDQTVAGRGVA